MVLRLNSVFRRLCTYFLENSRKNVPPALRSTRTPEFSYFSFKDLSQKQHSLIHIIAHKAKIASKMQSTFLMFYQRPSSQKFLNILIRTYFITFPGFPLLIRWTRCSWLCLCSRTLHRG